MIPDDVVRFSHIFDRHLKDAMRYCFFTRGVEFQRRKAGQLASLIVQIQSKKQDQADAGNSEAANYLLAMEFVAESFRHELEMYVKLKSDDMDGAWDELIYSQSAADHAISAHESVAVPMRDQAERLQRIEDAIFPPQTFMSPGFITRVSHCSICGKSYQDCDHIKGKPYNGELCAEVIEKAEVQEISIVPKPANKHARILAFERGNTKWNQLTLRRAKKEE